MRHLNNYFRLIGEGLVHFQWSPLSQRAPMTVRLKERVYFDMFYILVQENWQPLFPSRMNRPTNTA